MSQFSFDDLFPNIADFENKLEYDASEHSFTVKASEVYEFLRIESSFDEWFQYCSEEMGLTKGRDFIEVENTDLPVDYLISNDLAMHFCMMSDSNVAHQIRKYFIKSADLYRELMNAENMKEFTRIHTEYIEFKSKATDRINAGLEIE